MIKKRILLFTFFSCSKIEKDNFMRIDEKASSIPILKIKKEPETKVSTLSEFFRPVSNIRIRSSNKKENSNIKRPRIFKNEYEKPNSPKKEIKKYLSFEDLLGNMILMLSENENQILDLFYKYKDSLDPDLKKLLQSIDDNDYTCLSCSKFCSSFDQIYLIYSKKENIICFKCEKCKKEDNKVINLNENIFEIKTFYFFPFERKINEILKLNYSNCNIEVLEIFNHKLKSLYQEINSVKNITRKKSKRKGINVSLSISNLKKKIFPVSSCEEKNDSLGLSSEDSREFFNENDNSELSIINNLLSEISSIKSKDKDPLNGEGKIEPLIKKIKIYTFLYEIKVSESSFLDHRKKTSIPNSLIEILENKTIEELEDILKKIKNKKDFLNFLGIETFHMIKEYDENKLTISEFQIVVKLYNELYNDFIKSNKEKSYSNYINFSNFENLANTFCIDDFEKICKNYFKADFIAQNYINNNLLILKLNINQILIILECKDQAEINFIIDKTSKISNEYNEEFILEIKKELLKFREYSNYNKYLHIDSNPNLNTNYPGNFRNNDVRAICKNLDTGSTISSIGSFPTSSNDSFNSIIPKKFDTGIYTPYTPQSLLELCKKKY
jgi:hypothetical protein